jgi:hypothetical protein
MHALSEAPASILPELERVLGKGNPEDEGAHRAAEVLAKYAHDRAERLREAVAQELARFCNQKMRSHFMNPKRS